MEVFPSDLDKTVSIKAVKFTQYLMDFYLAWDFQLLLLYLTLFSPLSSSFSIHGDLTSVCSFSNCREIPDPLTGKLIRYWQASFFLLTILLSEPEQLWSANYSSKVGQIWHSASVELKARNVDDFKVRDYLALVNNSNFLCQFRSFSELLSYASFLHLPLCVLQKLPRADGS